MFKRIAVIGLGPMGKAITRLYLNNHYQVSVWNRTGSKADEMARVGAKKVLAIADLLKENHTIILSLTDYDVMYKLLNAETENLKGRTLINLSSDTPENARKAQGWATSHGANYIT